MRTGHSAVRQKKDADKARCTLFYFEKSHTGRYKGVGEGKVSPVEKNKKMAWWCA